MKTKLSKWFCYLVVLLGLCMSAHAQVNSGSNGSNGASNELANLWDYPVRIFAPRLN